MADDQNPLLVCPWHTWGYELKTGRCAVEPSLRIRTYTVEIRNGHVWVDL